jgi:hypothetical protein
MQHHIQEEPAFYSLTLKNGFMKSSLYLQNMFFAFLPLSWKAESFLALEVKEFGWRSANLLVSLQAEQFVIDS